jgi:hypothetical protein
MKNLLDHPLVLARLFYPRPSMRGLSVLSNAYDGIIPASDPGIDLGYRLFFHTPDAPVILFFHGNGELASDYDFVAPLYHHIGLSLLVFDYRGYGWSGGTPLGSRLLPDAEAIVNALPALLGQYDIDAAVPLWVMGRSLGGASAVHAASTFPHHFRGLILESTFSHTPALLTNLGLPGMFVNGLPDPWLMTQKIGGLVLPLLVIHGEDDRLISIENAERIIAASPASSKHLLRIANGGHNNLLDVADSRYFDTLSAFIANTR